MTPRARIATAQALLAASQALSNASGYQCTLYARVYRRLARVQRLLGATTGEVMHALAALPAAWWRDPVETLRLAWWYAVRALDTTCVRMRRIRNAIVSTTRAVATLCDALRAGAVERRGATDERQLALKSWAPLLTAARARRVVAAQTELAGV